ARPPTTVAQWSGTSAVGDIGPDGGGGGGGFVFVMADRFELLAIGLGQCEQRERGAEYCDRDQAGHARDVARCARAEPDKRDTEGPADRLHERQPRCRGAAV